MRLMANSLQRYLQFNGSAKSIKIARVEWRSAGHLANVRAHTHAIKLYAAMPLHWSLAPLPLACVCAMAASFSSSIATQSKRYQSARCDDVCWMRTCGAIDRWPLADYAFGISVRNNVTFRRRADWMRLIFLQIQSGCLTG